MKFKHTINMAVGSTVGMVFLGLIMGYMKFMDWLIDMHMSPFQTIASAMAPLVILMVLVSLAMDVFIGE